MSLHEEIQLQAKVYHEPENVHAFQKLIQLSIRKGAFVQALSLALDHFLIFPEKNTREGLYHCRRTLYLAKEKELPLTDLDRTIITPIPFSKGILILFGGRIGSQVTQLQDVLNLFLSAPQVILDFFNVRFIDSTSLGYLAHWLSERKKSPFQTYGVDMNERVKICFKHLDLYPLLDGPTEKDPDLLLPECLSRWSSENNGFRIIEANR